MDNLLKHAAKYKACSAEHAAGAWRLLCLMYKAKVDEKILLENITASLRDELDASAFDYKHVLATVSVRDAIT